MTDVCTLQRLRVQTVEGSERHGDPMATKAWVCRTHVRGPLQTTPPTAIKFLQENE